MKMELIQPFINAADAVLAEGLQCSTTVGSLSMEEEAYRRKGVAALIWVTGDIEGRVILDLDTQTAVRVASKFAGTELPESDTLVRETVCELANQVTGNAITALNDQGFHFRVHPGAVLAGRRNPDRIVDTERSSTQTADAECAIVFCGIAHPRDSYARANPQRRAGSQRVSVGCS